MNWLNINVTVLDSEEFLGADPVERATWLCLLRYCIGQENSGRITGAKLWKDRKWQQVVRVTMREVASKCELWQWDGDDLVVTFYPQEKEAEVQQKRENAKTNGARGGRPKKTDTGTDEKPTLVISEKAEREREVEGEREGNNISAPDGASSDPMPSKKEEIVWNSTDGFAGISDEDYSSWAQAFPALDIDSQIARADQWLLANPTKRKKAVRRFLVNWLSRAQERGGDRTTPAHCPQKPNDPLGPQMKSSDFRI